MRGKLVNENIRFDRSGDPRKSMDVGLRGDPDLITIQYISRFNPKENKEEYLNQRKGEEFLKNLVNGKIKEPHFYSFSGYHGKTYNAFQYPPSGILNTPFLYHGEIHIIPERILYESVKFQRGQDPRKSMNIGIAEQIHQWFDETFPSFKPEYRINKDNTIDILSDFDVPDTEIGEFPDYINFRDCFGEFMVDYCKLTSLRGSPERVEGYFSCEGNKLDSLKHMPKRIGGDIFVRDNPGKFTKADVLENLKYYTEDNRIYAEDSRVDETMRAKYVFEAVSFQRMGPDAGKHAIAGAMGIGHEGAKFDFGKYKGESAYEVFEKDPQYILWLAGGGMNPRNEKQRKVLEIVKQLEKQYYEDIEKQGWEYFGKPGDKFEADVEVEYVRYVSGDYGAAYTIQANDGKHKFRFYYNYNKAQQLLPDDYEAIHHHNPVGEFMETLIGKKIRIKGKVKYHKEFKGYPWTNLNYVNILEILD